MILPYLRYLLVATTRYRVHSPFVFEWASYALDDRRFFYAFDEIEYIRTSFLEDDNLVEVVDLGAGSRAMPAAERRKISDIARTALSPASQCEVLFKTINWLQPQTMLEIGTSLGISTLYQNAAAMSAQLVTLEGSPAVAGAARRGFLRFEQFRLGRTGGRAKPIQQLEGDFAQTLPLALAGMTQLDYVFFDGNHRYEPTMHYFKLCLEKAHAGSVFVVDDIHWSGEMEQAWREIQQHPSVRVTIDVFHFGLVFFRAEQREVEHFVLIPSRRKPWLSFPQF